MNENITELLKLIEKENQIKILFAVENGSRSWGMESKDSDYDVRFVFYRKKEDYLRLNKKDEVITIAFDNLLKTCQTQGSLIDMCGFDIYKYLRLLLSSNPTTLDNISLREYMNNNFNPEKLYMHYFSLFKNNYREFIQQEKMITHKKYLYSMRGLLNAKYVLAFDKLPPLNFVQTINDLKSNIPNEVYSKLLEIIELKSKGLEKDKVENIREFDNFCDEVLKTPVPKLK